MARKMLLALLVTTACAMVSSAGAADLGGIQYASCAHSIFQGFLVTNAPLSPWCQNMGMDGVCSSWKVTCPCEINGSSWINNENKLFGIDSGAEGRRGYAVGIKLTLRRGSNSGPASSFFSFLKKALMLNSCRTAISLFVETPDSQ